MMKPNGRLSVPLASWGLTVRISESSLRVGTGLCVEVRVEVRGQRVLLQR